jgi:uncharacterized protein YjbJ (UPF0337 family)
VNKDQVKGKVKDIAGRVERQTGEWTGDSEAQVRGAAKQAEGKVQKAWGDLKESVKKPADKDRADLPGEREDETAQSQEQEKDLPRDRKAS